VALGVGGAAVGVAAGAALMHRQRKQDEAVMSRPGKPSAEGE